MVHSRFSEELISRMSQNFSFIRHCRLFQRPHRRSCCRRKPDVRTARGKTGRVVGHFDGLITLMSASRWVTTSDTIRKTREPLFDNRR
jgi:argininosuccinate lyase